MIPAQSASLSEQLRRHYGVEQLTEEICRRHGVWGLHFGVLRGRGHTFDPLTRRDRYFSYCEKCLVPWFVRGLHAPDCEWAKEHGEARRLPLSFEVKKADM